MSKVYDQLHEAAQSGRSDVIGRAVEDWLNGVSTSEELADVVSAETRPTVDGAETGYSSTESVIRSTGAPGGA
jgi:hypothetical protein